MALPSTPLLDDFSRPDENPLSGDGKWAEIDTALGSNDLAVATRLCRSPDAGEGHRYWTPTQGFLDTEVWMRLNTVGTTYLWARLTSTGGTNQADGYVGVLNAGSIPTVFRLTDGAFVNLGNVSGVTFSVGDIFVMRVVAFTITLYRVSESTVFQAITRTDTTRQSPSGAIGVGIAGTTARISQFGGGAIDSLVPPAHPVSGFGGM